AVEPSDLVIFAVKSYGLADAISSVQNYVTDQTLILSFLNGISSEGIIAQAFNPQKVVTSMVAGMDSTKSGNSVNYSQVGYVAFGSEAGRVQNDPADLARLARFFDRVKQPYERQEDVTKPLWWKYMLNVGINQTSALLNAPYRLFQESAYAQEIMLMAMREVAAVGAKLGIGLNEGDIDDAIRIIYTLSPDGKTSMFQDIDARRPSEVDIFSGVLIELAHKHGVPVPVNTFLYNAIKALESQYI
ncbi:MAG: 2-dehydropantoate 2-reductase, partial [Coriobacteriia bacterium]|nr:2-dehydropantoate 2-reductase [Coriobacteriia bacterium]